MILFYLVVVLIVLACSLLTFFVIIQNHKGGGLANNFQAVNSATQVMGVRRATNFVEQATWWLAGTLVLLTFLANIILATSTGGNTEKGKLRMSEEIGKQRIAPAAANPQVAPNPNTGEQ
jgi:preprotein translocase subunit SecG